jgi:hypothetical protein
MSIQVLLPKDSLLRNFSIVLNNEELPIELQTKEGPIRERNAATLVRGKNAGFFLPYIKVSLKKIKDIHKEREVKLDKTLLDGNHQAWKLIDKLISDEFIEKDFYMKGGSSHDISEAHKMCSSRLGHWVSKMSSQSIMDNYSSQLPVYSRLIAIVNYMEETRDSYNKAMATEVAKWKRGGEFGDVEEPDIYSKDRPVKYYQVGTLVLVRTKHKDRRHVSYVMTNVHFSRVLDYIKSMAIFSLYAPDIHGMDPDLRTILKLFRYQTNLGLITPNGVGSVFKTARQFLFLNGDKSNMLGSSPTVLFSNGLEGVKEKYAEKAADFLLDITNDRKSALNLANIYKMVPHPDSDLEEVFESIDGFKRSNPVDESKLPRFEGMARRSMYESLSQQKIVVRAEPKAPEDDVSTDFARKINSTSTPTSSILAGGFTKWSGIKFLQVRGIFDSDKQDIPTSNKSSAPRAALTNEEIEKIGNFKTFREFQEIRERLKAVNDVVTVLAGRDELSFREARKRFREVIREHEAFERNYLEKGISIDDIDSDDLSDFIRASPDRAYTVLTEPKLGEVHKEVTRLFYMAEQALKIMTQVCERFTKKVISKSSGISIVKGFRGRRKEIEAMLHSYTGILVFDTDDNDPSVLYISFDMSEFSKKFPQVLVRIIGKILSELSGEDWMGRIDIFFRAAMVYHNTRGFLGVKSGVTGGFEGFLNFLWTLAMKVVMDIATQSTGVQGVLAVYSDDGLLRLYISGDKIEVAQKVKVIREVFKNYGLIFHLDKTVVSTDIFEYLGMYAESGNLIPTWVKEVTSIGKRKQDKGLETVSDRIELWESQSGAVVKAQGPVYPSMLTKTILTMSTLRRLNQRVSSKILAALTVIPHSAGGFRLSSISEMSLLSSVEGISEFTADLELIHDAYPGFSNAIYHRIYSNLKTEKEAELTLMTGAVLQTNLPDTSGLMVTRKLIESSNLEDSLIKDPITPTVRKIIVAELRLCDNFSPRVLKNLIAEVPDVIEYSKSIAIVKSSAALQFVRKEDIKRAQSSDTRLCKRSISEWEDYITTYDYSSQRLSSSGVLQSLIDRLYPSYHINFYKESPRVALSPVTEDAHILTSLEITKDEKLLYQEYVEPKARFLGAQLTPEISAESTYNTQQRRNERFVNTAARLVATNVSLINLYYIVANTFKLPCPTLPTITVTSGHRSTRNFGMNAVTSVIPVPFHALISSRMSNKMWSSIPNKERSDRTTMVEAAKIATYLNLYSSINTENRQRSGVKTVLYKIRNFERNISNPVFSSPARAYFELIDDGATRAFNNMIIEENLQANLLDSSIEMAGILEVVKDAPEVRAILLVKMEKWLYSCLNRNFSSTTIPTDIPDPWKKSIYMESVMSVSFRLCAANTRRAIQLSFARFLRLTDGLSPQDSINDFRNLAVLNGDMTRRNEAFDQFESIMKTVSASLSSLDLDTRLQEELLSINLIDNEGLVYLVAFMKRRSVTGGKSHPTVIINTDTHADTRMSREVKNAIKDTIDSLLVQYLARASANDGDQAELDTTINFLSIMKTMIRPSGHRNTPFNKHMFAIQMLKFELFVQECITERVRRVTPYEMENYRLPRDVINAVLRQNAVIGGRTNLTTGEEMRRCLINEGVPGALFSRANYILNRLRGIYTGNSINEQNILTNENFMVALINYVLATYNDVVTNSISALDIRHSRESTIVGESLTLTPVEEASMIAADVSEGPILIEEENLRLALRQNSYRDIVANLLISHYARWGPDGYQSGHEISSILRERGLMGSCTLSIRDREQSPFLEMNTTEDFTLSMSRYARTGPAIHNYLKVNRLAGGMAVMGNDGDSYVLIAIIPKGVTTINTAEANDPDYLEGGENEPPIYMLERVQVSMMELARVLNARPRLTIETGEMGSIVLQQAYQRIVGARGTIEDEDHFVVAMSELVRGSWSVDMGKRVLALMTTWISSNNDPTRTYFAQCYNALNVDPIIVGSNRAIAINNSTAAVWEWIRMLNIHAGPNIDTVKVERIVRLVSQDAYRGGFPTAVYNMAPVPLNEVKEMRGNIMVEDFILQAPGYLFRVPADRPQERLMLPLDYSSEEEF